MCENVLNIFFLHLVDILYLSEGIKNAVFLYWMTCYGTSSVHFMLPVPAAPFVFDSICLFC